MPLSNQIKNLSIAASQVEKHLIDYATKENFKKRFGIGKTVVKDKFLHTLMIHRILSRPLCEIRNFTEKVILEGNEDCKEDYNKIKIKTGYIHNENSDNVNEVCNVNCVSKIEW
jgi:poly-beta-hydroxyalkanoate depolymerase